jgi:hypothetical protein
MKSLSRNKKAGTAGKMSLPLILATAELVSANKKRSLSCRAQPGTPTEESAARDDLPVTVQSTPTLVEATSTTSSLSRTGKLLPQRKSVAEGCGAPEFPPIVVCGRDNNLDQKSQGNQTLLKLISLNLIPYREAHGDVRAVLVRKIIQQMRDWRGRFVRFNKEGKAWEDLPSDDASVLVRGKFDEEALKRQAAIDATIQRFLPKKADGMDKDQLKAYKQFTPVQRVKFQKLCLLDIDDVGDAVTLIEIPPWTHTAVVSPTATLSPETLQKEHEGGHVPARQDAHEVSYTYTSSGDEQIRAESCSWVDELMLATQDSEESATFDENTPLLDPMSSRHYLWGEDAGLPESDSQQVPVPVIEQGANFRKFCQLRNDDVGDAVTLIEIPPWTHTAVVSPIPETLQNEHEGEKKRRKKSRKKGGYVPARQDAHEVSYNSSGDRRFRTESWVDALMLATQDNEELFLFDDNTSLLYPMSSRRHLWGEDL